MAAVPLGCGPSLPDAGDEDTGSTNGSTSGATDVGDATSSSGMGSTSGSTSVGASTSTTTNSTSGVTTFDTTATGGVHFECDLIDQGTPCEAPPGLTHCVPFDPSGDGSWSGSRCTADGNDEHGVGAPCSIPEGPIDGQRDCAKGLACAAADIGSTEGICVQLCYFSAQCSTGRCYPCSVDMFPTSDDPIGMCLDDIDCTDQPACAVAGCWPTAP